VTISDELRLSGKERLLPAAPDINFQFVDGEQANLHMDELAELYAEVYAEPPYDWGDDHVTLFRRWFDVQRQQQGFTLVEARQGDELVGIGFGVTLLENTPWWQTLVAPLDDDITRERPQRTFAVVELLVRSPWRRQHIAETIHGLLLQDRSEERATLTVLPAATAAQAAYDKWGWQKVAQKHNPLPGSPVFDVLVKELEAVEAR
jgi:hypothetical protein